jgi:hypothetical protein
MTLKKKYISDILRKTSPILLVARRDNAVSDNRDIAPSKFVASGRSSVLHLEVSD